MNNIFQDITYISKRITDKGMGAMEYKGFCNQVNQLMHREYIVGNSLEIDGVSYQEEVRKDIEIQGIQHINIWGQLRDESNEPVVGECVRLIRIYDDEKLEMVQKTMTDELGYYTLSVYGHECEQYAVLVDYKMINPKKSSAYDGAAKMKIGLAATKHKCISDYVKFSK